MKLTIKVLTDNAAFGTCGSDRAGELRAVLVKAGEAIDRNRHESLDWESVLFDTNGSSCGIIRGIFEVPRSEMIARNSELAKAVRLGAARIRAGAGCLRCGEAAARSDIGETCSACGAGIVERVRS